MPNPLTDTRRYFTYFSWGKPWYTRADINLKGIILGVLAFIPAVIWHAINKPIL